MPITGQGDPYPKDLIESIPENLRDDFDQFTQFVFETGAVTWYGSNIKGTKDFLLKVLDLAVRHNIQLPDLGFYINPPVEQHDYWGSPLSDEELKQWRDMT